MKVAVTLDLGLLKPKSWVEGMKALREAGATRVELQFNSYLSLMAAEKLGWRKLRDMIQEATLRIAGVHAPFIELNIASPVPSERKAAEKSVEKAIEIAYRLEADYIVIHPGTITVYQWIAEEKTKEKTVNLLKKLSEKASDMNVVAGLENLVKREYKGYWFPEEFPHMRRPLISTPEEHMSIITTVTSASAVIDLGHYALVGVKTKKAIQKLASIAIAVHAHNNDKKIDCHWPLNRGSINWREALEELKRTGYKGYLTIENFRPDWVRESICYLATIVDF